MNRIAATISLLALLVGASSGCTADDPGPTPTVTASSTSADPTTSTPIASPSPSTSEPTAPATSTPPLTEEQEAASNLVLEFFRLQDEFGIDDSLVDLTPITSITTGEAQQLTIASVERYRELNAVQIGRVDVAIVTAGPLQTDEAGEWVDVVACADATEVDMVSNDTGESVFSDQREPINEFTLQVDRAEQGWLISQFSSTPVEACE